jgi:NADH-quinone oxidoreductase subunit E
MPSSPLDEHAIKEMVKGVIEQYGGERSALVDMLHELTRQLGYLSGAVFVALAEGLGMPVGEVYSVASFYTMLLTEPRGKHLVQFCESAPCHLAGGNALLAMLQEVLGISAGETSADGNWTLIKTSCLGQCAEGPILVIDDHIYSRVTRERLWKILAQYTEEVEV